MINVDETWLPHLDFRNQKWGAKNEKNTVAGKDLVPKVNMIVALDTEGRVYAALT